MSLLLTKSRCARNSQYDLIPKKKAINHDYNNYRTISLVSNIGKIRENLIH